MQSQLQEKKNRHHPAEDYNGDVEAEEVIALLAIEKYPSPIKQLGEDSATYERLKRNIWKQRNRFRKKLREESQTSGLPDLPCDASKEGQTSDVPRLPSDVPRLPSDVRVNSNSASTAEEPPPFGIEVNVWEMLPNERKVELRIQAYNAKELERQQQQILQAKVDVESAYQSQSTVRQTLNFMSHQRFMDGLNGFATPFSSMQLPPQFGGLWGAVTAQMQGHLQPNAVSGQMQGHFQHVRGVPMAPIDGRFQQIQGHPQFGMNHSNPMHGSVAASRMAFAPDGRPILVRQNVTRNVQVDRPNAVDGSNVRLGQCAPQAAVTTNNEPVSFAPARAETANMGAGQVAANLGDSTNAGPGPSAQNAASASNMEAGPFVLVGTNKANIGRGTIATKDATSVSAGLHPSTPNTADGTNASLNPRPEANAKENVDTTDAQINDKSTGQFQRNYKSANLTALEKGGNTLETEDAPNSLATATEESDQQKMNDKAVKSTDDCQESSKLSKSATAILRDGGSPESATAAKNPATGELNSDSKVSGETASLWEICAREQEFDESAFSKDLVDFLKGSCLDEVGDWDTFLDLVAARGLTQTIDEQNMPLLDCVKRIFSENETVPSFDGHSQHKTLWERVVSASASLAEELYRSPDGIKLITMLKNVEPHKVSVLNQDEWNMVFWKTRLQGRGKEASDLLDDFLASVKSLSVSHLARRSGFTPRDKVVPDPFHHTPKPARSRNQSHSSAVLSEPKSLFDQSSVDSNASTAQTERKAYTLHQSTSTSIHLTPSAAKPNTLVERKGSALHKPTSASLLKRVQAKPKKTPDSASLGQSTPTTSSRSTSTGSRIRPTCNAERLTQRLSRMQRQNPPPSSRVADSESKTTRTRTGSTQAIARRPPLQEAEGIVQNNIPLARRRLSTGKSPAGLSEEDAVVLSSGDEDNNEVGEQYVSSPKYKCCAGVHCTVFNHGTNKRNAFLSTHKCLDCNGKVHAPGDVPLNHIKNPCCLSLEDNKPLLRRVRASLGEEKANPVGCICRKCFLAKYEAMSSPPPSPPKPPSDPSCAVCYDCKDKDTFDSLVAVKNHPRFEDIVKAARKNGETLEECDYGNPVCRDCCLSLLGGNHQAQDNQAQTTANGQSLRRAMSTRSMGARSYLQLP